MPRKRVMVCVGRSWDRPVRMPTWRAVVPETGVRLWRGLAGCAKDWWAGGGGMKRERYGGDVRPSHVAGNGVHNHQREECINIRHQRYHRHELRKLPRRPRALEVAASMPDRQPRDGEREDVGLDEGGGDEGPGVDERHRRDEGEVWDH